MHVAIEARAVPALAALQPMQLAAEQVGLAMHGNRMRTGCSSLPAGHISVAAAAAETD